MLNPENSIPIKCACGEELTLEMERDAKKCVNCLADWPNLFSYQEMREPYANYEYAQLPSRRASGS